VAVYDVQNTGVQSPKFKPLFDKQIEKANSEISKAVQELEKDRAFVAIMRLSRSWLRSQLAIRFAKMK
jgi:hypothetical protein